MFSFKTCNLNLNSQFKIIIQIQVYSQNLDVELNSYIKLILEFKFGLKEIKINIWTFIFKLRIKFILKLNIN